ncbi:MAG TPA: hypothetical protein DER64_16860 [Planctomycetaceae bacterium]|nr:hypothetical protein [Planctomycetaceae bacterium]
MFRQDRTNPSKAVSNWKGRLDSKRGHPSTLVSNWTNGALFGGGAVLYAGYIAGGPSARALVAEQLSFPDEVGSVVPDVISLVVGYASGCANNEVAGYTGSGYNSGYYPAGALKMSKWMFATRVRVNLTDITCVYVATNQGGPGYGYGSYSNSGVAGYMATGSGRCNSSAYEAFTTASAIKTLYSNDTQSIVHPAVTLGSHDYGGTAGLYAGDASQNSGVAGYYAGGIRATQSDQIDKMPFSTETPAMLGVSARMATGAYYTRCTANQGTAQYIFPGSHATGDIDKLAFSSDTTSVVATDLSSARSYMGCFTDSNVAFYVSDATAGSTYDRFALPSDTRSVIGGMTDGRTGGPSSFSNQADF